MVSLRLNLRSLRRIFDLVEFLLRDSKLKQIFSVDLSLPLQDLKLALNVLFKPAGFVSIVASGLQQFNFLLSQDLASLIVFLNFTQNLILLVLISPHDPFDSLPLLQPVLIKLNLLQL